MPGFASNTLRSERPQRAAVSGGARRDPEATRRRILAAATREFSREGYGGARGARIARQAGCSERMVYYYYGSKRGLFRAVLEAIYLKLREFEYSLELDHLPPGLALRSFCLDVWRWYCEHPEFIGLLGIENQQKARHLRESERLGELVSPVVGLLATLIDRGVRTGEFRGGIDPVQLYLTIAALGYFQLSNRYTLSAVLGEELDSPARLHAHWEASADVVLRYVRAEPSASGRASG
jgi:AcrR family transcriptional regulator